jgi:radical SAM protein with 4Fe4S-binding SPASM domain
MKQTDGLFLESFYKIAKEYPTIKADDAIVDDLGRAGIAGSVTTNGVLLDMVGELDRLKWVKVSVNGCDPETYKAIHKSLPRDWDKVWSNIRSAARRTLECTVGVQCLALPEVAPGLPALAKMAREAGADYLVIKPYSQHKMSINRLAPLDISAPLDRIPLDLLDAPLDSLTSPLDDYLLAAESEARPGFDVIVRRAAMATKSPMYSKCHATPHMWAYVMASGDVYSCSAYLLDERFKLGNIHLESFGAIWAGERRRANYKLVRDTLDIHECRVNCRMDKVNRYLERLAHPEAHDAFI